jgi:hypothetical protein
LLTFQISFIAIPVGHPYKIARDQRTRLQQKISWRDIGSKKFAVMQINLIIVSTPRDTFTGRDEGDADEIRHENGTVNNGHKG